MKRKILFLILFPVWLFQCFILPFVLKQQQEDQYKLFSEMEGFAKLKRAQMILFGSRDEIHWVRKNKEFLREGKLYDVISLDHTNNGISILCVQDNKEDKIKAQETELYTGAVKDGSKRTGLFQYFTVSEILRMNACEQKAALSLQSVSPLPIIYSKVFAPPPDNFFS